MKVLITIPCLLTGGTEIQTLNLVQALVQDRHQVVVVCYFEYSQEMVYRYQETVCKVMGLNSSG